MECFADDLIGDVRAIEVAGVDVIHAIRDRFTEHRQGSLSIFRRPHDPGPGQLHGAVTQAVHTPIAKCKSSGVTDIDHGASPCQGMQSSQPAGV